MRKNNFLKWIKILIENQQTYGVVFDRQRLKYDRLINREELVKNYILPDLSAKSFIFPSQEKVFSFSEKKNQTLIYDIQLENISKKILLGVRPCDAIGINYLSSFFKEGEEDQIIQTRREKIIIISSACNQADEYCFCTSVGGNPGSTEGSDILLTKTNTGDFLAEVLTEKGKQILSIFPECLEKNINKIKKENYLAHVPILFETSYLTNKIDSIFNSSIFEKSALKCLGCHVCAYVCPTCSCFDLQDQKAGSSGYRVRCWDSCSSQLFTRHASGHNPRPTQGMRWKQRLMHKFSYYPKQTGKVGCVGCGRCSRLCPVGINLVKELTNILGN